MIKLLKYAIKCKLIRTIDLEFAKLLCSKKNDIHLLVFSCLSYYSSNGHTCIPISMFENKQFFPNIKKIYIEKFLKKINHIKQWERELIKNKTVSNGKNYTPVIIHKNNIYLYKNWYFEKQIVKFIKQHNKKIKINNTILNKCKIEINKIKSKQNKIAIAISIINNITFIIGGPGTGKTNIIKNIINIITKIYNINLQIKVAAFTGKATQCIINKLHNNKTYLIKNQNNTIQITTIHNLLGINIQTNDTYFGKKNKLIADIIIIDEASMIDLSTMNKLIDATSKYTKMIFLGDVNQLPPINNGSILKDLSFYAKNEYSKKISKKIKIMTSCDTNIKNNKLNYINDCIYILKDQYRFKKTSEINILSNAIIKKDNYIFNKIIKNKFENITVYSVNKIKEYIIMINNISLQYLKYIKKINKCETLKNIFKIFNQYKTLCVINNTMFGTKILNKNIENQISKIIKLKKYYINNNYWYCGKPIILKKNNKQLNLFNGDIGITIKDKNKKLKVCFIAKNNEIINIPIEILHKKEYDIAWSITIHKSQGSEFENVSIVLPNRLINLLNQELLYTAITRSKKKIEIFSNKKILLKSLNKTNIRYSGIKYML